MVRRSQVANNNGGCLSKLIGWAVVIALVVILAKSCGFNLNPFGSSASACDAPVAAPVAHADNCDDLRSAAIDPNWAAHQQQRPELATGKLTTGLFFTTSPDSYIMVSSGKDALSDRAQQLLIDVGYSNVDPHPATHVETKIAAKMHDDGATFGVLVINNAAMCPSITSISCGEAVRVILPAGATLYVWTKDARSVLVFRGRGS
jgi:nucleic acid/nucleotide deaminase of polymorphic system toxin